MLRMNDNEKTKQRSYINCMIIYRSKDSRVVIDLAFQVTWWKWRRPSRRITWFQKEISWRAHCQISYVLECVFF